MFFNQRNVCALRVQHQQLPVQGEKQRKVENTPEACETKQTYLQTSEKNNRWFKKDYILCIKAHRQTSAVLFEALFFCCCWANLVHSIKRICMQKSVVYAHWTTGSTERMKYSSQYGLLKSLLQVL